MLCISFGRAVMTSKRRYGSANPSTLMLWMMKRCLQQMVTTLIIHDLSIGLIIIFTCAFSSLKRGVDAILGQLGSSTVDISPFYRVAKSLAVRD